MTSTGRVEGDESLRLFLALRLPPAVLDQLERWYEELRLDGRREARRVPREHLHVTLAFLGARPARELPEIVEALRGAAAGAARFELRAERYRETRSVGMLVLEDPSGEAGRLAAALHERLVGLGIYRREARRWLPHVTVLRFRERPRLRPAPPVFAAFVPSDAAAFLSRLHPAGARYEVLDVVPLAGPRGQNRRG
jgi:2'-5' RNA ligase